MEDNQYLVTWTIQIDAPTPEAAALMAREYQEDSGSLATNFDVRNENTNKLVSIDTGELPSIESILNRCYIMSKLNDINGGKINSIKEIKKILNESTIFDKIEFSGITKEVVRNKILDLENRQVPGRGVLLEMKDSEVVQYWFKNWLHPMLRNAVNPSPKDKTGCSQRVLNNDLERDTLRLYENSQFNFKYTLSDIKIWLNNH